MEGNQEAGPKGETGLDNGQEDDQRCEAAQKDDQEAEETGKTSPKAGAKDRILLEVWLEAASYSAGNKDCCNKGSVGLCTRNIRLLLLCFYIQIAARPG